MDLHQDEVKGAVQKLLELKLEYKRVSGHEYQAGAPPGKVNEAANGAALAPDCVPSDPVAQEAQTDHVDPWNVQTSSAKGIDYDKLIGMASGGGADVWRAHQWFNHRQKLEKNPQAYKEIALRGAYTGSKSYLL